MCRRRHCETLSVVLRLRFNHFLKDFAERTRVLGPDVPGHLVDRATGQFQHLARLADGYPLTIFGGLNSVALRKRRRNVCCSRLASAAIAARPTARISLHQVALSRGIALAVRWAVR